MGVFREKKTLTFSACLCWQQYGWCGSLVDLGDVQSNVT